MRRIATGLVVVLSALALGAASAQAADRHAAPAVVGTGDCSSPGNACGFATALSGASAGDDLVLEPGSYAIGDAVSNLDDLTVRARTPASSPDLDGTLVLGGAGTRIADVRVTGGGASGVVHATAIERVVARDTGAGVACRPGTVIADSVCASVDGTGAGLRSLSSGSFDVTLRNVTAIGGQHGLVFGTFAASPTTVTVHARNVIADATGPGGQDILLDRTIFFDQSPVTVALDIRHSSYGTIAEVEQEFGNPDPGDLTVTLGPGNLVGAAPAFENASAGDFRPVAGSPTIDAGSATGGLGTTDVRNEPRIMGTAVDIGAHEFPVSPAPDPGPPPPATPAPPATPPPSRASGPAPDRAAPRVTAGRVAPASFTARRPGRASFRLSEAATLRFQVERRAGKRWRALGRPSSRKAPAGRATIRLPRNLPAARYRLVITATDAAGNRSAPVRLAFGVRF